MNSLWTSEIFTCERTYECDFSIHMWTLHIWIWDRCGYFIRYEHLKCSFVMNIWNIHERVTLHGCDKLNVKDYICDIHLKYERFKSVSFIWNVKYSHLWHSYEKWNIHICNIHTKCEISHIYEGHAHEYFFFLTSHLTWLGPNGEDSIVVLAPLELYWLHVICKVEPIQHFKVNKHDNFIADPNHTWLSHMQMFAFICDIHIWILHIWISHMSRMEYCTYECRTCHTCDIHVWVLYIWMSHMSHMRYSRMNIVHMNVALANVARMNVSRIDDSLDIQMDISRLVKMMGLFCKRDLSF